MDTICRLGRTGEIAWKIAAAKRTVARASVSSDRSVISRRSRVVSRSCEFGEIFGLEIFTRASRSNKLFGIDERIFHARADRRTWLVVKKKIKKKYNWTNEHLSKFERECLRLYNNHATTATRVWRAMNDDADRRHSLSESGYRIKSYR